MSRGRTWRSSSATNRSRPVKRKLSSSFLFDEAGFHAAHRRRQFEQFLPAPDAFAKQHTVTFLRVAGPILEMMRFDSPGDCLDERDQGRSRIWCNADFPNLP
jgi:hypothetical protein